MFAQLAALFPEAPIYTALYDRARLGDLFPPARVHVSPLDRIPGAHRAFRLLAPLYPRAFEAFDLRAFDLVISSTTAWAKGIRFRSDAVHVSYLHTVSRFAYDYDAYVGGFGLGRLARPLVAPLVAWDRAAAQRPTALVASSRNAAARIARWYAREAQVVYPPVDLERFPVGSGGGPFVVVARLLPYKRVDLAIAACAALGLPLVVAGEGPARRSLERLARGTRTEFAGALDDASVARLLGTARAAIVAGEEDFGLVALEANACGRPVIALGRGGACETVLPGRTGELFAEPTVESLAATLRAFEPTAYDSADLRAHAERFSPEIFRAGFRSMLDDVVARVLRAERGRLQ